MVRILNQRLLFVLFCLYLIQGAKSANAQDLIAQYPKVNIVSPTATSLGKYVDFPVSLHTGIPDINIPIYTVQEGPLQLPISLSYHASGLKVMEIASWVGAGWSLNAGGVVSRTIKALPDEKYSYDEYSFFSHNGFSNYFLHYYGNSGNKSPDYLGFFNGRKDSEPDLFTFSFGGYGGKFYFREDLTPVLFPEGDIKIEPILKLGGNSGFTTDYIQGFQITTPDGVKYYFGVTPNTTDIDPIEKSSLVTGGNLAFYPTVISSWYLNKIQTADSKFEINISYRKEDYGYHIISTQPCVPNCDGNILSSKVIALSVSPQRIEFTNGSVEFVANNLRLDVGGKSFTPWDEQNTEAKSLDSIKIISKNSAHSVVHKLAYDYITTNSQQQLPNAFSTGNGGLGSENYTTDKKRLNLNSIQELSLDGTESKPPFSFYYYDEELVPRRLSFGQDHWGFNNGVESNTSLIPSVSADAGISYSAGDDREAKWPQMRAGSLRQIQYPTGGITEYVYEPNSVATIDNCTFQRSYNNVLTVQGGMDTPDAGFGPAGTLVVTTPSAFYYSFSTSGTNAAGELYIDNTQIANVSAVNRPLVEDYIFLQPGNYTIKAYANADNGGGVGVIAYFYSSTSSCNPAQEKIVGGLRIKKINKSGTNNSPKLSRSYKYEDASLYSIPDYIFKLRNEIFKTGIVPPISNTYSAPEMGFPGSVFTYRSPTNSQPLQTVQGYHIGYKKVTEIFSDGGYTVNEYKGNFKLPGDWYTLQDVCVRKINSTICNFNDPIYPAAPLVYDFERGHLKSQQIFDKNNRKVKEINYSEEYIQNSVGVFGVVTAASISDLVLVTHYDVRSGKLNWTKQVEKIFDQNGASINTETTTYFNSTYNRMLSKKTQTGQIGLSQTDYQYVSDLTKCNYECPSCATDYRASAETLRVEYDIKDKNWPVCSPAFFLGWTGPSSPCYDRQASREAAWRDYQYRLNEARITYTNCIKLCKQTNNCIADGLSNYYVTSDNVKALYLMEQGNDLKVIESTLWNNNILQASTLFDYRPFTSDPTKVYLKNVFETEVGTPVSSFSPASILTRSMQKDSKYSNTPISTYLFNEGQPVEIVDRNGLTTSFIWGFNNTVPIVKAIGVQYSILQAAYNNSPLTFRNDSSLSKAQVTSYTYDPVVGIKSITDANRKISYYEYDKLGRLISIKDNDGKVIENYEYKYRTN